MVAANTVYGCFTHEDFLPLVNNLSLYVKCMKPLSRHQARDFHEIYMVYQKAVTLLCKGILQLLEDYKHLPVLARVAILLDKPLVASANAQNIVLWIASMIGKYPNEEIIRRAWMILDSPLAKGKFQKLYQKFPFRRV